MPTKNDDVYTVTLGGLTIEKHVGNDKSEIHSAGELSWTGSYNMVVTIEKHIMEMLKGLQKEGEDRAKKAR